MSDVNNTLAAIDTALGTQQGCAHCGGPLDGSPSPDFCSEDCDAVSRDC